ncbi:DNA-binding response OmpR family regulator [Motilibacter peucedani]|uniref:DNA-binding response OmpR family regulator n=1 Tax=Motilibacter peucedani TaxID=598650 RepID=A0A420XTI4_9ACTN|nr:response regulator transcription factor [Motilibacter peucedani]RKS80070.1 DNA-binding response OmpR family regulator [Motilibacter peucedani]
MVAARVLVVEDDSALRRLIATGLRDEGFTVATAPDAAAAVQLAERGTDLLVLDVGLPDADGRDLCAALRARGVLAPVLFLTARDAVHDRLSGFAAGGDDYLTKPFHFSELVARLSALLKRTPPAPVTLPGLQLDPVSHSMLTPGGPVPLTPTEFRLLSALVAGPGQVVRRRDLVRAGWPEGARVHDNTLDQYVARLRRKLREAGSPVVLETAHGIGYRCSAPE